MRRSPLLRDPEHLIERPADRLLDFVDALPAVDAADLQGEVDRRPRRRQAAVVVVVGRALLGRREDPLPAMR